MKYIEGTPQEIREFNSQDEIAGVTPITSDVGHPDTFSTLTALDESKFRKIIESKIREMQLEYPLWKCEDDEMPYVFSIKQVRDMFNQLLKQENKSKCIASINGRCDSDYSPLKCDGINIPNDCSYALKQENKSTWVCDCNYVNFEENKRCHRCYKYRIQDKSEVKKKRTRGKTKRWSIRYDYIYTNQRPIK